MAEFFLSLFIFIGIMAVTVLVFGGWAIVTVVRGIGSLFGVPPRPPVLQRRRAGPFPPIATGASVPPGYVQCRVPGCRHLNPIGAKFCRHCGHAFPLAQQANVRRSRGPLNRE